MPMTRPVAFWPSDISRAKARNAPEFRHLPPISPQRGPSVVAPWLPDVSGEHPCCNARSNASPRGATPPSWPLSCPFDQRLPATRNIILLVRNIVLLVGSCRFRKGMPLGSSSIKNEAPTNPQASGSQASGSQNVRPKRPCNSWLFPFDRGPRKSFARALQIVAAAPTIAPCNACTHRAVGAIWPKS